jgi:hypothetical protein
MQCPPVSSFGGKKCGFHCMRASLRYQGGT